MDGNSLGLLSNDAEATLLASLYRPEGRRWQDDLVVAPSPDGRTLDEAAIADLMTGEEHLTGS